MQAEGRERLGSLKAAKGQFEAARNIAAAMEHPDYVLAAIAVNQFEKGDEEAFRSTLAEVDFPVARVGARTGAVHQLLKAEKPERIAELLEAAAEDAETIEHDEEKIRALVEIGTLFVDAKQNGKAIEIFDRARAHAEELDNVHRDSFMAAVSVGFLRAGSQELADRALDLVEDKTQIATCLLGHAQHYWSGEAKDDALESLEESHAILRSQKEAETRSSRDKYRLFGSIALQYAAFGKGERAIEIAEGIEDENENMSTLAQIATLLTSHGDDELARRALNAIPEDAQRTFALIGMSDAKEKLGERTAAIELLDEAMHLAETVPQLSLRTSAYNELARRFAKYEDDERLVTAVHNSFGSIAAIRDESVKVISLTGLSVVADELELAPGPEENGFLKKAGRGGDQN